MFNMGDDMMKQWTENWEKLMGEHMEKLVHNKKFISEMSKSIAATMNGKAMFSKALDDQLAAANIPSRTELIKVMQKLTDVEERLIDLSERFEDFANDFSEKISALEKISAFEKKAPAKKPTTKRQKK